MKNARFVVLSIAMHTTVIYQRTQDLELQFAQFVKNQERECESETQDDTLATDCFVPNTDNIECRTCNKKIVCLYCGTLRSKLPNNFTTKHDDISYMEENDPSEKNNKNIRIRTVLFGNNLHNNGMVI